MPLIEISDLVVAHDPRSGARLPVSRTAVVERLRAAGDLRGARIATAMRAEDDVLDPSAVRYGAALGPRTSSCKWLTVPG